MGTAKQSGIIWLDTVFLFKSLDLHHSDGLYRMYYPLLINMSNVLHYSIVLNFHFPKKKMN